MPIFAVVFIFGGFKLSRSLSYFLAWSRDRSVKIVARAVNFVFRPGAAGPAIIGGFPALYFIIWPCRHLRWSCRCSTMPRRTFGPWGPSSSNVSPARRHSRYYTSSHCRITYRSRVIQYTVTIVDWLLRDKCVLSVDRRCHSAPTVTCSDNLEVL